MNDGERTASIVEACQSTAFHRDQDKASASQSPYSPGRAERIVMRWTGVHRTQSKVPINIGQYRDKDDRLGQDRGRLAIHALLAP